MLLRDMGRGGCVLCCFLIVASLCHCSTVLLSQADVSYPTNVSSPRVRSLQGIPSHNFLDGSSDRRILVSRKRDFMYACGFYCNNDGNAFLFAVYIIQTNTSMSDNSPPKVVWSANRNRLVGIHAKLKLTRGGGLELQDGDGSIAWSTNTSGKPVMNMRLNDTGNLVLFGENNSIVWQSFDWPTDTLLPGQRLVLGQKLIPSVSRTNWTERSVISLALTLKGLFAQVETNPPQIYYKYPFYRLYLNESIWVEYINGGLALLGDLTFVSTRVPSSSLQYLKLDIDGQLRAYSWDSNTVDLMKSPLGACFSPLACKEYEICSNGQCNCPSSSVQPNAVCSEVNAIPLSCDASSTREQDFLMLRNVTYFAFEPDLSNTTRNHCRDACANNCSCKAAFFRQESNLSNGSCYLPSRLFSLINMSSPMIKVNYTSSTAYLKVQSQAPNPPSDPNKRHESGRLSEVLGLSVGALVSVIGLTSLLICIKRKRDANEIRENDLDRVPRLAMRFTYGYLKAVTNNFEVKLGEGAFGSVYQGTLSDGTRVAVKLLDQFDHVMRSFLAEVESIGSIHHVNLVRLVGFSAERSHRLLVYEYMSNGSLDRWIFPKSNEHVLDWRRRKSIILDIARGLNYLHQDCRQKIIHMDIKPQNILLDENFNAKVSDFGLSKLIARDQSHVVTTMRGTPGYLAPEWLSAAITEKVDVYSFGVVTLEIVCGRRVFDRSRVPEEMNLLSLMKKKARDGSLLDLIDGSSMDIRSNEWEAMNMVRVAAWCLEGDFTGRPSMSTVIKVLEGAMDVPGDVSYNFFYPSLWGGGGDDQYPPQKGGHADGGTSTLVPATLSGPR